jgi:hypothetical protein
MPLVGALNKARVKAYDQFMKFARGQVTLSDHFPHVVLFKYLADKMKLCPEDRAWLCFLYMAYYDDGSCWLAFNDAAVRERRELPPGDYPISKQRRNLFGGRINRHFEALYDYESLYQLVDVHSWDDLLERVGRLYGNGRWASYTTAEMLVQVCDLPIDPDTFEIDGSSGPSRGLEALGLPQTEHGAEQLWKLLRSEGMPVPPEVFESLLCNWSRMNGEGFYLGHNLDRQQGRLAKAQQLGGDAAAHIWDDVWHARKELFPRKALGELYGWPGIDKPRLKVYQQSGEVLEAWENR